MTREVFLSDLQNALHGMTEDEISSVIAYYSEMIDDRMEAGMTEEDAVNAMEPVVTIASRVLSEAGVVEEKAQEDDTGDKEIRKSAETICELHVIADDQRVRVMTGDTDEIVLRYHMEDGDIYRLHEENGVLTLEHTRRPISSYKFDPGKITAENLLDEVGKFISGLKLNNIFSHMMSGSTTSRGIDVLLPHVFRGALKVQTSNSSILAENVTCLEDMKLQTSNARVTVAHAVSRTLRVVSSNGRITLEDVYAREKLEAITSNSGVYATGVTCDQELNFKTSNGRIEIEKVDAQKVVLKTSNGSISGSVKGAEQDYTIQSGTSNARNTLRSREGGEKLLVAKTCNGSISVGFENESAE